MKIVFTTIFKLIPVIMRRKRILKNCQNNVPEQPQQKQGLWDNLMRDDNDFNTMNFFLVAATLISVLMLLIPAGGIIVDIIFNHTITVDMNGIAAYIVSVAGVLGAAGISNAWTEYSYQRYHKDIFNGENEGESSTGFKEIE